MHFSYFTRWLKDFVGLNLFKSYILSIIILTNLENFQLTLPLNLLEKNNIHKNNSKDFVVGGNTVSHCVWEPNILQGLRFKTLIMKLKSLWYLEHLRTWHWQWSPTVQVELEIVECSSWQHLSLLVNLLVTI